MRKLNEALYELRNRNPHWRLPGAAYYITCRLHKQQPGLVPAERGVIAAAVKHFNGERYKLYAMVVMDDHFHVICQPLAGHQLSDIIHAWKSFTANQIQRIFKREGAIWQKDYYDRIIRSESDLFAKLEYVLMNPNKRWIDVQEYEWVEWFPEALG